MSVFGRARLRTLRNVYIVGSPTVGPTSSSVRLRIYVPSHNIVDCDVKQPIHPHPSYYEWVYWCFTSHATIFPLYPREDPGVKSRMCPPFPSVLLKATKQLNGAVSGNNRTKRVAPCRCLDGHVKETYEMSMAFGARPQVQLLRSARTSMCRQIYN